MNMGHLTEYRRYIVVRCYMPQIFGLPFMWQFCHVDFDGAPDALDYRYGYANSYAEAERQVDLQWEDGAVS